MVTGASSGVGRAVALRLAAGGALVVAVGRDEARLASLVKEAEPATVVAVRCDLTDDDARSRLAADVMRDHGRLHQLVHSAGGYVSGPVEGARLGDLDAQYTANVRAPYALTQDLLPALRAAAADRGAADVVVINSSQGVRASGGASQFAATQHAMRAVADSLRQEVNTDGIRVCSIHLGRTATPRQESIFATEGPRVPAGAAHPGRRTSPRLVATWCSLPLDGGGHRAAPAAREEELLTAPAPAPAYQPGG